jgi:hypothetical protein
MVEQNIVNYAYTANATPADNATEVPRLNQIHLIDAPKFTTRANYNLRLDYKLSAMPCSGGAWTITSTRPELSA